MSLQKTGRQFATLVVFKTTCCVTFGHGLRQRAPWEKHKPLRGLQDLNFRLGRTFGCQMVHFKSMQTQSAVHCIFLSINILRIG